ncbi:cysteine desulfurase family protein [Sediminitomix flava]|uniref:Cysteine desulfurase n=1 Tax=Sediminitomix flava TaxID=379075 RepID=A0A315ZI31_SEDFL|nr:cysteine desulfurase family protein [Sediminitomix flava]PWJ44962.1 cysteine desulfurase [Sediminitomix flava]
MRKVYLDNAASTFLDKEVLAEMVIQMENTNGNPNATHSFGRDARGLIETARQQIAKMINASTSEIIFTGSGTEADNLAIRGLIKANKLEYVISSRLEHHAVGHTIEELEKEGRVKALYVHTDERGNVDYEHLEELLKTHENTLVSLMHGNNEVANLTDLERVGSLCEEYDAFFHTDTVQTMGHLPLDVKKGKMHALVGSAHKFHGPKGIGFLYLKKGTELSPEITGGGQEKELRSGTENLHSISAMAKALQIATDGIENDMEYIKDVKSYFIQRLRETFEGVQFNGMSEDVDNSLYTVLSVSFPPSTNNGMLLFMLDLNGIAASGGSACSSGAQIGSHVLSALRSDPERGNVRFSFCKHTTKEEIDYTIEKLGEIYEGEAILK